MCIGFWALDDPLYSLILCANRDEFLDRPTLPAAFHDFLAVSATTPDSDAAGVIDAGGKRKEGSILSGIDIKAGGTWLGINKRGRVAMITNVYEPVVTRTVSRGLLTSSFLKQQSDWNTLTQYIGYAQSLGPGDGPLDVGGFNLVVFEPYTSPTSQPAVPGGQLSEEVILSYEAALVTNSGGGRRITSRPIGRLIPGPTMEEGPVGNGGEEDSESRCGGISNAIDGSAVDAMGSSEPWTKLSQGRKLFSEILAKHHHDHDHTMGMPVTSTASPSEMNDEENERLAEDLFALLGTTSIPQPHTQHDRRNSIFIPPSPTPASAFYGTRLSTVILVRRHSRDVLFIERDRSGTIPHDYNDNGGGSGSPVSMPVIYNPQTAKLTQRTFRFQVEA
ncbi:hypothetical protein BS47DRAFT_1366016 [Hydnum rufescens UP504]|uniref:DUF833-domain-containing protein n=1 Tax=Hydnum rufescens UP504 TaxID=1448309 RepID=A0A9P6DMU7_9AGAM|nr:hypothetical protein BS47DRAFT_1366016 [Hydnum rufescens UP504]